MSKKQDGVRGSDMEGPDFGEFTVAHQDEEALLSRLWAEAAVRPEARGVAQVRMEATDPKTRKVMAVKSLILDIPGDRLVVIEERDGRVTARRTVALDSKSNVPDTRPPALTPGPAEADFHREPFLSADLDIDEELRDWVMSALDERLPGLAGVVAEVGIYRARTLDAFIPGSPLLPANIARLGATLHALRMRPGVLRSLVEGWVGTDEAAGLAFVFEPLANDGWWLGTRPFRRRAGPIGEWTGPWKQQEGTGPSALPMQFRALRWPLATAVPFVVGEPSAIEFPEMEVRGGTLPASQVLPRTAADYAALAALPFESDAAAQKGAHAPRAVVFRGRQFELWQLEPPLPTDLDDVMRNIAMRGVAPDAMALVQFGLVPIEGGALARCLLTVSEYADARHVRAMELRMDAEGSVVATRYLTLAQAQHDDTRWIGVEPITRLSTEERLPEPEQ